jgi:iron complex transport system ATP-binding protein
MRDGKLIAAGTVHGVVNPDILRAVFGVECTVLEDTQSGRPVVIPRSIATPVATPIATL